MSKAIFDASDASTKLSAPALSAPDEMTWEVIRDVTGWEQQHVNKLVNSLKRSARFSGVEWPREPEQFFRKLYQQISQPGAYFDFCMLVRSPEFNWGRHDEKHIQKSTFKYDIKNRWYSRGLRLISIDDRIRGMKTSLAETARCYRGHDDEWFDRFLTRLEKLGDGKPYIRFGKWLKTLPEDPIDDNWDLNDSEESPIDTWSSLAERLSELAEVIKIQPNGDAIDQLRLLCSDFEALLPSLPDTAASLGEDFRHREDLLLASIRQIRTEKIVDWFDDDVVKQIDSRWKLAFNQCGSCADEIRSVLDDFTRAEEHGRQHVVEYESERHNLISIKNEIATIEMQLEGKLSLFDRRSTQQAQEKKGNIEKEIKKRLSELEAKILSAYSPNGASFDYSIDYAALLETGVGTDVREIGLKSPSSIDTTEIELPVAEAPFPESPIHIAPVVEAPVIEIQLSEVPIVSARTIDDPIVAPPNTGTSIGEHHKFVASKGAPELETIKCADSIHDESHQLTKEAVSALLDKLVNKPITLSSVDIGQLADVQRQWLKKRQPLRSWCLAETVEERYGVIENAYVSKMLPAWANRLLLFMSDSRLPLSEEEVAKATSAFYQMSTLSVENKELVVLWMTAELLSQSNEKIVRMARLISPQQFDLPPHSLALLCAEYLLQPVYSGNVLTPPTNQSELERRYRDSLAEAKDLISPTRNNYKNGRVKAFWRSLIVASGPMGRLLANATVGQFQPKTLSSDDITSEFGDWSDIVSSYRNNIQNRIEEFIGSIESARSAFYLLKESRQASQATVSGQAVLEIREALERQPENAWWIDCIKSGVGKL
jgi:hypothetical protein